MGCNTATYRLHLIDRDSKGMKTLPSIQNLSFNPDNVSVYEKKFFLLMYEFLYES
nr:ASFV G ACD 00210 [African swine fever virus]